jgi:hypothetical protein
MTYEKQIVSDFVMHFLHNGIDATTIHSTLYGDVSIMENTVCETFLESTIGYEPMKYLYQNMLCILSFLTKNYSKLVVNPLTDEELASIFSILGIEPRFFYWDVLKDLGYIN